MVVDLFCSKCGSIMVLDRDKSKLNCVNCKYSPRKKVSSVILSEKVELKKDQEIEVQDKKIENLPKVKEECSKCGNRSAYYWTLQTRAGDEAETRFFECTKCKHRWRAYD